MINRRSFIWYVFSLYIAISGAFFFFLAAAKYNYISDYINDNYVTRYINIMTLVKLRNGSVDKTVVKELYTNFYLKNLPFVDNETKASFGEAGYFRVTQ